MNDKKENGVRDDWVLVGRAITDVSRGYCLVLHENCVTWARTVRARPFPVLSIAGPDA